MSNELPRTGEPPRTSELPKTYDPAAVEAEAYQTWLDEKCFRRRPRRRRASRTRIVIPPPNVTGALHLGHAINNTLQDILIRMHRMAGFNTLWIPGIDHAGIATQAVVEKQLKEKENKTRHDVGREGLVERIWAMEAAVRRPHPRPAQAPRLLAATGTAPASRSTRCAPRPSAKRSSSSSRTA